MTSDAWALAVVSLLAIALVVFAFYALATAREANAALRRAVALNDVIGDQRDLAIALAQQAWAERDACLYGSSK